MRKIILILILLIRKLAFTQEKLYYFYTSDSTLVGVKNEKGKIIIPAQFSGFRIYDTENPINEPTIEFWGTSFKNKKYDKDNPRIEAGEVYDRNGKFLYYPQWFDNGNDIWEEGLRRYVEKNKMGFVDWFGKKVLPAKWDFATQFNYGYAIVYTGGWKREFDKGGEHWFIAPISKKSTSYLINKKGIKVKPLKKSNNPKDYLYEGKYYPYPFVYNNIEQKIVDEINQLEILTEINHPFDKKIINHYEIVNRPNKYLPYYELKNFYGQEKYNSPNNSLWVNKKGEIFYKNYDYKFIPLKEYIRKILERIIEDQKQGYKTKDYPINAEKQLKEIKKIDFKIKV